MKPIDAESELTYTQAQRDFIRHMLDEIPEVNELWQQNLQIWGEHYTYNMITELHPFVMITENALLSNNNKLAKKILDLIEQFLSSANQESKNAIAYFFFEDILNSLSWENKKYTETFSNLLEPNCKECCKTIDKSWGIKKEKVNDS